MVMLFNVLMLCNGVLNKRVLGVKLYDAMHFEFPMAKSMWFGNLYVRNDQFVFLCMNDWNWCCFC